MHEQEVLALLRAGDERGAEALLRHYAPLMRYIIAPIVPDAQDREECLSDAALRVWEKFGTYDPARSGTGCSFTASITTASPPRRSPRSWERRSALWRGGSTASKRHCARRWEVTTHERPRI